MRGNPNGLFLIDKNRFHNGFGSAQVSASRDCASHLRNMLAEPANQVRLGILALLFFRGSLLLMYIPRRLALSQRRAGQR